MTLPASTKATINGAPIPNMDGNVVKIRYVPGINWQTFSVVSGVGDEFDKAMQRVKKDGAVTIEIECADPTVSGSEKITLKGWHLIKRKVREATHKSAQLVEYQFADVRWRKNFNKLTASYNIVSYGGRYREDTLYNKITPWRVWQAAFDALKELKYDVKIDIDDQDCYRPQLPDNMSNAKGGGFVEARQDFALPPILEAAALNMVPNGDGGVNITDRHSERSKDLKKYLQFAGGAEKAKLQWQFPKYIVVPFPKRIERLGSFDEDARATSSSNEYDVPIENVIPKWVPGTSLSVEDHQEIDTYLLTRYLEGNWPGPNRMAHVRKHYLHKRMFDLHNPNLTTTAKVNMEVIEQLVRSCFRKRYRFKTPDLTGSIKSTDELRARYADLQLGRLKKDGTTRKDSVYCDYVRDDRFGRLPSRGANAIDQVFSDNIPYTPLKAAPFTTEWLPGGREDLIFELIPDKPDSIDVVSYIPGRLNKDKNYDFKVRPIRIELDDTVELTDDFKMEFHYHGLWVYDGKGDLSRTYEVKLASGLQNAGVEEMTAEIVQDMTANYSFVATASFPGRLMNRGELKTRADQVREEIVQSYKQGRAGIVRCAGINVLTKGKVWVGGDISAIEIVIGSKGWGSVETHVHVMPGRRPDVEPVFTGPKPVSEEPMRIL